MAVGACGRESGGTTDEEGIVRGTIVCGVTDGDDAHAALELGVEVGERLGAGRGFRSKPATELESESPVPILIAPPANGRRRRAAAATTAG
jgi:hypothetical protein